MRYGYVALVLALTVVLSRSSGHSLGSGEDEVGALVCPQDPRASAAWFQGVAARVREIGLQPQTLLKKDVTRPNTTANNVAAGVQPWRACALVGNSGALRLRRWGAQIDSADVVVRLNQAPLKGYASMVGARASVRLLNRYWTVRYGDARLLKRLKLPLEHNVTLALSRMSSRDAATLMPRIRRALRSLKRADVRVTVLDSRPIAVAKAALAHFRRCQGSEKRYSGGPTASTGLLAAVALLAMCESVTTYGIGDGASATVAYQYYKLHGTEQAQGYVGHSFDAERDFFKGAHDAGVLTMCSKSCRLPADGA